MWLESVGVPGLSLILALETSCDDTCAAVVDGADDPLQRDLLAGRCARALRRHRARGRLPPPPRARQPGRRGGARRRRRRAASELDSLAVTRGPGLIGALLVGVSTAKALAAATGKPLAGIDHLHGHVAANFLEPDPLEPPFLCLIASGGHTLLAGVTSHDGYRAARPDARRRGGRGARQGRPPARARLSGRPGDRARGARTATRRPSSCPIAMTNDPRLDFSFSGLKTALLYAVRELGEEGAARAPGGPRGELSGRGRRPAGDQAAPRRAWRQPTTPAARRRLERGRARRWGGGELAAARASRRALRGRGSGAEARRRELCTDNAAMIASAARFVEPTPYPGLPRLGRSAPDSRAWQRVTIYGRAGCHLCDEARAAILRLIADERADRAARGRHRVRRSAAERVSRADPGGRGRRARRSASSSSTATRLRARFILSSRDRPVAARAQRRRDGYPPTARSTDGDRLSLGVAARLSRYLQVLIQARKMGRETISSQELAEYTHINSTQIRRDLSGFGKFGKRGVGYRVESLVSRDPQDPAHLRPAQHRPVRRRQPRPGDRQLRHLRRPRLPDRRDLRCRPRARRARSTAACPVRALDDLRAGRPRGRGRRRRARGPSRAAQQVADQLVEAGREDHLQLLRAAPPGAARGHRPHLEPRRRPALRALLLPRLRPWPRARPSGHRASTSTRTREVFEASQDFTIGLEEEFALVDPDSLELVHRFEELYGACLEDELLAESAAGELIDTEIEIRSGRAEGFAEAVERQQRAPRATVRARRAARDRARRHRHPSVGELPRPADHRHRALQPAARGAALGRAAQQHLERSRARRHPRCRPRDRRLRPPARAAAAAARAVGELALPRRPRHRARLGADRDLHPHLPALRGPGAVRRLARLRRVHRPADRDRVDRRGDPALVERAPASPLRHRRAADLRRPDRAARSRSASRR